MLHFNCNSSRINDKWRIYKHRCLSRRQQESAVTPVTQSFTLHSVIQCSDTTQKHSIAEHWLSVPVLWPFTIHNEHWHAVNSSSRIKFDSCSCRSRGSERVNEQCQSVFSMLSCEVLRSLARWLHGRWLASLFCVIGASTAAADISCDDQSLTGWELAFMSATWQYGHRLPLSKLGGSRLQGWVLAAVEVIMQEGSNYG